MASLRNKVLLGLGVVVALGSWWLSATPSADLSGLWMRPSDDLGERALRFYYFHGDGKGLYRYGRFGLNDTASFDYAIDGNHIDVRFRKTGQQHHIRFAVDASGGLTLFDDPREGRDMRYERVRGPLEIPDVARMWTKLDRYATGGYAFAIYQLQAADENGRGRGWFHRGDFDDWSTEALTYAISDDTITLTFDEHGDVHTSRATWSTDDGRRTFTLAADPRGFWHQRTFVDGGRSFEVDALGPEMIFAIEKSTHRSE